MKREQLKPRWILYIYNHHRGKTKNPRWRTWEWSI
ncbi:hypothetical protein Gotri_005176 [Gossypium trilobum]|uniref:Uncharacterized protein n=1 Tax=Gossypium trilobum TaxID=34281 RepID=A0A7J9EW57_9ROSI|nr:hypothetical protein [Gossypium trilobum]